MAFPRLRLSSCSSPTGGFIRERLDLMASTEDLKVRQAMRAAGREFGLEITDLVLDGMAGAHLLPDALPPEYAEVISDAIRGTAGTIAAGLEQEGGAAPKFRDRLVSAWIDAAQAAAEQRTASALGYRDLGRRHGREFAALALEHIGEIVSADVWTQWMAHRVIAMGDELRSLGATEQEVCAWRKSCFAACREGIDAGNALARICNKMTLAAMVPLGTA
jgi:hypothetical protein